MKTLIPVLLVLSACGGTVAQRRTFPVEVAGVPTTSMGNDKGWVVTLTEAKATVGPVRFFSGKVLISRRWSPLSLFVGTAHAHPGHYVEGEALGEVLTTKEVDLLATGPTSLGDANAVTGEYGSMELTVTKVRLKGTATLGATTVDFDTTEFTPKEPLAGIRFEKVLGTEQVIARINVGLQTWVTRIDFAKTGGASAFAADSEAFNAFNRGVLDTSAYDSKFINP